MLIRQLLKELYLPVRSSFNVKLVGMRRDDSVKAPIGSHPNENIWFRDMSRHIDRFAQRALFKKKKR
jgi:hypothetical protein